jgi:predicted nucleotide-binding protein
VLHIANPSDGQRSIDSRAQGEWMSELLETLERLIVEGEELLPSGDKLFEGYNGTMQPQYIAWRLQCLEALAFSGPLVRSALKEVEDDVRSPYFCERSVSNLLGVLKGAHALAKHKKVSPKHPTVDVARGAGNNYVFLVHGRDETLLHQTARFLEKLQLKPIVLFEKPGQGKTILEKLERYGNTTFAVVLLTPDDVGRLASEDGEERPRARQNVVLELGYFLGRLGRENVAVLYDQSVELPSDYRGVEYIAIDASGAWELKLAKELRQARLPVDLNDAV